jgi:hypothetical protein
MPEQRAIFNQIAAHSFSPEYQQSLIPQDDSWPPDQQPAAGADAEADRALIMAEAKGRGLKL